MSYRVAVVGATGAVGRQMIAMLEQSPLPIGAVDLLASARSAGTRLRFRDDEVEVRALDADAFTGVDVALFSAGGARSLEFAPHAVRAGAVVIDNSSAWRMDPTVPLVVPEVNAEALNGHRGIIANPNCSTIQMVLPLQALQAAAGLRRVVVATYQSASGAGQSGIDELFAGARAALAGEPLPAKTFSRPLAFDVVPQIGDFTASGYTSEEEKMLHETRKILGMPGLPVSATCVRVPVERGHLEAVTVDLERPLTAAAARAALAAFPGVIVKDDPTTKTFPVARDCVGRPETFVGRVREDAVLPATLHFWVVSDNLLKGAAWNAVQIAEVLHDRGLVHAH
ncbi:MAG: aspartate-semialdehyde dehydrogenase [Myxococcales bacterium]|nr:aspartate-semialdehyde dehydrogenase [Myxococcales bacterium]